MKVITAIFKYLENLWIGKDGRPSVRASLAILFSVDFVSNISFAIKKWEVGKSYSDVAMLLGIEAGLIAALLSLTTYQNILSDKNKNQES